MLADAAAGLDSGGARAALDEYSSAAAAPPGAGRDSSVLADSPAARPVTRAAATAAGKLQRQLEGLAEGLAVVGGAQLLRRRLALELRLLST